MRGLMSRRFYEDILLEQQTRNPHATMRKILLLVLCFASLTCVRAQYNIDRLLRVGQSALYYEDYVLSIQYFSRAIASKPYLYEPWLGRGEAKFRLDDYVGAEADCTEAIRLNPYVPVIYELRGLCRIKQNNFSGAVADYDKTIEYEPDNKNLWYNRVLCKLEDKDYDKASADLDVMMRRWPKYSQAFRLKAELCLQQKDTLQGSKYLDQSLELNPYDGEAWATRSMISLAKSEWKDAEQQLSKAIHLKPSMAGYYVNRALARYNINNLRGALADYDKAIELEPNNFLAHYNRGQLRVQVGDDNRAVEDFDFIIRLEPGNVMAIYNRALLRERIGNLRGAIADYSALISQFPNFWVGLSNRARCYRRLGMTAKAELDEFRIFKAQNDKSNGYQPRWSKKKIREVRKRSEINFDKYNQLVVDDKAEVDHEYENSYRGKVQNRHLDVEYMPMYQLSFIQYNNGVKSYVASDETVDRFNKEMAEKSDATIQHNAGSPLQITCNPKSLDEETSKRYLVMIDSLSDMIQKSKNLRGDKGYLLKRAVAYCVTQNYYDAENDLSAYLQIDSTSVLAYWQRAVCLTMLRTFDASMGGKPMFSEQKAIDDLAKAISHDGNNAYLYYDRANLYAASKDYDKALADYDKAISIDGRLAEAYYNRGMVRVFAGNVEQGVADLSKAGELGLVDAYVAIKKYGNKKGK